MALKFAVNNSLSAITSLPASISGGVLNLISTQTASSSATIDFTSGIDSTYKEYIFKLYDIHPATDGTDLSFQVTVQIDSAFNADSGFRVNGESQYYNNVFSGQVMDLAAGEVIRVVIHQGNGTHNISGTENRANFGAFKLIT